MEEGLKLVVDWEVVNSQETGGKSANMQDSKEVSFSILPFGQAVAYKHILAHKSFQLAPKPF